MHWIMVGVLDTMIDARAKSQSWSHFSIDRCPLSFLLSAVARVEMPVIMQLGRGYNQGAHLSCPGIVVVYTV